MRKTLLLASVALAGVPMALFHTYSIAAQPAPSSPAQGALQDPFSGRAQDLPPALRILQGNNVKITALGEHGGLRGYLLEEEVGGRMQVVYLTPDGTGMVVGVMQEVAPDGKQLQNVTTLQFAALRQRFEEARRHIEEQQRAAEDARSRADAAAATLVDQQHLMTEATRQFGGASATPGAQAAAPAPSASTPSAPAPSVPQARSPATPPVAPAPSLPPPAAPQLPGQGAEAAPAVQGAAARFATDADTAHFSADVEHTSYFLVGREGLPTVYMVADPQCPHCHAAWARLKPAVAAGKIAVKIILVALPGSEAVALDLISQQNPAVAWWGGEGSEDGHPIAKGAAPGGDAAKKGQHYLDTNMDFVRRNGLTGTPWLAYAARGKVYKAVGDRDTDDFLAGL